MTTDCAVAFVLKNNLKAVMQLIMHDLPEYDMQLKTTKCLNTGVMLMYMLFGQNGVRQAHICDVQNVQATYKPNFTARTKAALVDLRSRLFSYPGKNNREVFYVMITDGYIGRPNDDTKKTYFPGHVFMIDRRSQVYHVYQSFVNEYDLETFQVTSDTLKNFFARLEMLLTESGVTWGSEDDVHWKTFANVSTLSYLTGCKFEGQIHFCFRYMDSDACMEGLCNYLRRRRSQLQMLPPTQQYVGSDQSLPKAYNRNELLQKIDEILSHKECALSDQT